METKRIATLCLVVLCSLGTTMAQTEWEQYPGNPVIEHGEVYSWAAGIWANAVVFDGTTYHMWFRGTFDWCIPFGQGIGHATSSDGVVWTLDPANPIMEVESSDGFATESFFPGAVHFDGEFFHMWYTVDRNMQMGAKVEYAISPDGSNWTEYVGNPVMETGPLHSWDHQYLVPTAVLVNNGEYKMWYVGSNTSPSLEGKVGYAESSDGITWTKRPEPVLEAGGSPEASWETGIMYPSVLFDGTVYHMWYTGGYPHTVPDAHPGDSGASKMGYASSVDGISWVKYSGNPIVDAGDHFISQPIVLAVDSTFKMWYSHSPDNCAWDIAYATSDCCSDAPTSQQLFIPAAACAAGAAGSFFRTDVDINNAGQQPIEYVIRWLPRGEDNSEPTVSETFTLGSGMSVRYTDALSGVIGLEPPALGALAVTSSSPDLLAMSRTYSTPNGENAGTFGQAVPAVSLGEFVTVGERRRILFASENEDVRFNVGCQNGSDEPVAVSLELFNDGGTLLDRFDMLLPAWGNDQANRILEDFMPVNGYVDVWSDTHGALFFCYGSVVDNRTNDPTTILPQ